jgi:hypothetical protein
MVNYTYRSSSTNSLTLFATTGFDESFGDPGRIRIYNFTDDDWYNWTEVSGVITTHSMPINSSSGLINSTGHIIFNVLAETVHPNLEGSARLYDTYLTASNNQSCGVLNAGDTCDVSWEVNATGATGTYWKIDVNFTSNETSISHNDTADATIKIAWPSLSVTFTTPSPSTCTGIVPCKWTQYQTYWVNATIECVDGPCGVINGTDRYNASSTNPDTIINTTKGDIPFYNVTGENPRSCGSLNDGDTCQFNITVNATGAIGTYWKIDVNFASTFSNVSSVDTNNAVIKIVSLANVHIQGIAQYYFSGERVDGYALVIPVETPSDKEIFTVSNGEWSADLNIEAEDVQHLTVIIYDDNNIGFNEIRTDPAGSSSLSCSQQHISLSGHSVDISSGDAITSGNVRVSALGTDYTNTTTFTGPWSIEFYPCLIPGRIYTIHTLISDNTGKRGEYFHKYPAR